MGSGAAAAGVMSWMDGTLPLGYPVTLQYITTSFEPAGRAQLSVDQMPMAAPSPSAWYALDRRPRALAPVLAIGAVIAVLVYARARMLHLAANADALLPADLIWEMLHRSSHWQSFQWPRIPSLVPDLLVYAPLQAAFGWRWAALGYGAASLMALTALSSRVAGISMRKADRVHPMCAALPFLTATGVVLLAELAVTHTAWHLHLLAVAYHSGPFILSVGALLLAWRGGDWALGLMTACATLGTFSDRLMIATFLVPLAAALAVAVRDRLLPWRAAALRLALAAAGCGIGLGLDRLVFHLWLTRQGDMPMTPGTMLSHASAFLADPSGWFVLVCDACLLLPLALRRVRPEDRFCWIASSVAALLGTLLCAALWEDDSAQRYLSPVLWWPLLLAAPRLAGRLGRAAEPLLLGTSAGVMLALVVGLPRQHPLLAWTDPLSACIVPTGRQAGLADYWVARPLTIASDWHLRVLQIGAHGNARIWGNNPTWFTRTGAAAIRPPDLSFIVMRNLDHHAIRAAYGPPDHVLPCPGSDVWLYDDPARLRAGLARATPSLVPRSQALCLGPERFRDRNGPVTERPITVGSERRLSRPITWGPTLDLYPGRWRIQLRYRLTTDHPGADVWRVNGQWGGLNLSTAPLPPTGESVGAAETEVTLNRFIEAVEIPTFLAGSGTLQILGARLTPLDGPALPCPAAP